MKKSLKKRLCVAGMSLVGAFIILNIVLTYFFMIPFSAFFSMKQMEQIIKTIQNQKIEDDDAMGEYIEQMEEDTNTSITIVDEKKNVIVTTNRQRELPGSIDLLFEEELSGLKAGKKASSMKKDDTAKIQVIVMKKIGEDRFIILRRSYRSLQYAAMSAMLFDIVVGIVLILLSYVFVSRLSQYLVIPITDMTDTAERISNLEFDSKIEIKAEDELGKLGDAINRMSEHLERNLHQLQQDIEGRKRLVRNLSHEIKSPIAVIMGYADRLKNIVLTNPQKALSYCEIISNESDRANHLVREMLDFARFEERIDSLTVERFSAGALFSDIKQRFHQENMERNIQYREDYDKQDVIVANYVLLERAVYNLVSNAVAYGMDENMEIKIRGRKKEGFYEIRVYNSGSTIKEEEKDSIWEAFNKEDKARTRGQKGYGLGLSIVKEIVEAHSGYYGVENQRNGVEFTIAVKY